MDTPVIKPLKKKGHFYQLKEDYVLEFEMAGKLFKIEISKGFTFDGASIPGFFWGFPLMLSPAHPRIVAASVIHDMFYETKGLVNSSAYGGLWVFSAGRWYPYPKRVSKKHADELFFAINEKMGMDIFRRYVTYYAVRLFGRY